MDGNTSNGEGGDFDWDTEDELETGNFPSSSASSLVATGREAHLEGSEKPSLSRASSNSKLVHHFVGMGFPEETVVKVIEDNRAGDTNSILETLLHSASSSAESSNSKLIDHFVRMGFSEEMVSKAIQENGEENIESIIESLLTYSVLDEKAPQEKQPVDSDYEGSFLDDFSDSDIFSENEEITTPVSEQDNRLLFLVDMGYTVQEASIAIERCGPDSSVEELMDFINAAHMAKETDAVLGEDEPRPKHLYSDCAKHKKRKLDYESWKRKKQRGHEKRVLDEDDETIHLPNPMVGFGVPSEMPVAITRTLPEAVVGPPYFYYENVALTPKGVWTTISRFLYDVEPEFVDSKYFCAAARKRGYVHNLPIQNRFCLRPAPPCTIHEAFPLTRKWWPSWDTRTKLNCLQTCTGSAKLTERIRKALEDYDGEPPLRVQKYVLDECRKWNLVWVGKNKVAPLEPDEVEMLLGFPKNHTRGISRTDRYKSLGNSFQIDTVAYHLSVLKDMFPGGINMLSLFSGIGGAEVALHRLGVPMNNVVSVEILEVNRNIVQSWWDQTNQRGNLFHINDVQELDRDKLEVFMNMFGAFDLVIGGSPCNNLAGSNRHSRDGLQGKESALFYDYIRILDLVKCAMKN